MQPVPVTEHSDAPALCPLPQGNTLEIRLWEGSVYISVCVCVFIEKVVGLFLLLINYCLLVTFSTLGQPSWLQTHQYCRQGFIFFIVIVILDIIMLIMFILQKSCLLLTTFWIASINFWHGYTVEIIVPTHFCSSCTKTPHSHSDLQSSHISGDPEPGEETLLLSVGELWMQHMCSLFREMNSPVFNLVSESTRLLLDTIKAFKTAATFLQHCEACRDVGVEDQAVREGSKPLDQQ